MGFVFILIVVVIIILLVTILIVALNSPKGANHGAKCNSDGGCTLGLVCNTATQICVSPAGGTCSNSSQCVPGSTCIQGLCIDSPTTLPTYANPLTPTTKLAPPPSPEPVRKEPPPKKVVARAPTLSTPIPERIRRGRFVKPLLSSGESSPESGDEPEGGNNMSSIHSAPSSEEEVDESNELQHQPYLTRTDGQGKVCRHSEAVSGKYIAVQGESVIDVCNFSDQVLSLLESGWILLSGETGRKVQNSIQLVRIQAFSGYLYGISTQGILHRLDPTTFRRGKWRWSVLPWSPDGITSICATLNGVYLCLQTNQDQIYIYSTQLELVKQVKMASGLTRTYGYDIFTYVDVDPGRCEAVVTTAGQEQRHFSDVCGAVFSGYGQLVVLKKEDASKYKAVRLVNWQPFYLISTSTS